MTFFALANPELVHAAFLAFQVVWLFCFGAAVGSFLNVVIYRVPAGVNIAYPASRCPVCGHAIRPRDNLPIVGWLLLRGRCRDCGAPIAGRYPLVELLMASLFLLMGLEGFSGGVNLPYRHVNTWLGVPPLLIWTAYALHMVLIATLTAAAFIIYDGWRLPRRLFLPALVSGLFAVSIWPALHPLAPPGIPTPDPIATPWGFTGLTSAVVGLAVGALMGVALLPAMNHAAERPPILAALAPTAIIGLILGWQAACAITVAAAVLWLVVRILSPLASFDRAGPTSCLVVATVLFILLWKPLVSAAPWLGYEADASLIASAGTFIAVVSPLAEWFLGGRE